MKIFKRIIVALESLCLIGIAFFLIKFFFSEDRSVDYILSKLGIDLSKYETVYKKEDWRHFYEYKICFPKADSASVRKQVEKIKKTDGLYECKYDGKCYDIMYSSSQAGDYYYLAKIRPQEGTADLSLSFEFGKQMWYLTLIVGILIIALAIGTVYLVTFLVVKYLIR